MTDQADKGLFQNLPLSRPAAPAMREPEESLLLPGDRIPEFILPDAETRLHNFYDLVKGRPALFILAIALAVLTPRSRNTDATH